MQFGQLERSNVDANEEFFPSRPMSTGTTTMAAEFQNGVVMGADSRTTSGVYIVNRVADKLTKVANTIYCCRSGSAADTQAVADIIRYRLSLFKMENGYEPSVLGAANSFRDISYNYREQITAGFIVGGWDRWKGGQVYTVNIGGMLSRGQVAIGGSGSGYVQGFVDATYKPDMTEFECVEFVMKTVCMAMARDGSSGGCIRIGVITKDGIKRKVYTEKDFPDFYKNY